MAVRKVIYIGGYYDDVYSIGQIYDVFTEWHGDYWVDNLDGDWSLMDKDECEIVEEDDGDYDYYYRSMADVCLLSNDSVEDIQKSLSDVKDTKDIANRYAIIYNTLEYRKEELEDFEKGTVEHKKYEDEIRQLAVIYEQVEKTVINRATEEDLFESDNEEADVIWQIERFMNKYGYYFKDGWWRHIEDAAIYPANQAVEKDNFERHLCPVCRKTIFEHWWSAEACKECGWKDDGFQYDSPDYENGSNTMSVNQAKKAYAEGRKDRILMDLPYSDEEEN